MLGFKSNSVMCPIDAALRPCIRPRNPVGGIDVKGGLRCEHVHDPARTWINQSAGSAKTSARPEQPAMVAAPAPLQLRMLCRYAGV